MGDSGRALWSGRHGCRGQEPKSGEQGWGWETLRSMRALPRQKGSREPLLALQGAWAGAAHHEWLVGKGAQFSLRSGWNSLFLISGIEMRGKGTKL